MSSHRDYAGRDWGMGAWSPNELRQASTATILLVDDDEDCRIIYSLVLMRYGYRVLFARNGEDAVSVASHVMPDLVLMDLAMPRLDGRAALRALKSDPRTTEIPVLALTGNAALLDSSDVNATGFRDVLVKPIQPTHVLRAVRRVLEEA